MTFHIFIFALLSSFSYLLSQVKKTIGKKIFLVLAFFLLWAISALRSINIGNDSIEYSQLFYRVGNLEHFYDYDSRMEIGYIIFNKVLFSIYPDHQLLFFVYSAFVIGTVVWFVDKYSPMVGLSILLFFNLRFFYFSISGIRQSIALAIILISYKFLVERKFYKFVIVVIVASTFHTSALLFLLIYPISKLRFSKTTFLNYILIGMLGFVLFNTLIQIVFSIFPQYSIYEQSSYFENTKIASVVDFSVVFLILIFSFTVIKNVNLKFESFNESKELNILLHIVAIAVLIMFIAINASIIKRAAMYYYIFSILLIPKVIYRIESKETKSLLVFLIVALSFIYNLVILFYRPEWQHVYPYEFFWKV